MSAESTLVIAQIEDEEAIGVAEDIAAVDGIDGVFIGPVDLTISMGKATPADDDVLAAMVTVARGVSAAGKAPGIFVGSPAEFSRYQSMGLRFVLVRFDQSFVISGADAACE